MTLHNYRSRQVHKTLNGVNPSSSFRDMGSAKSGPSAAWFDKFLAHGQMGKLPWQCTTTGLDNSIELRMEKIRQAVTEIWVPQVWQPPARPPGRPPEPWRQYPSSPKGWGVKTVFFSQINSVFGMIKVNLILQLCKSVVFSSIPEPPCVFGMINVNLILQLCKSVVFSSIPEPPCVQLRLVCMTVIIL